MNTEKSPIVSVIIPCYNAELYLEKAVESVLSQTLTDIECIIVDDGSIDNTRKISVSVMNRDKRVKYLYKRNGGVASARNLGIKYARGKWIQFLDADDWLNKDKLRFQLNYHNPSLHQNDVVLFSDYEVIYQDSNHQIVKRIANIAENLNNEQLINILTSWQFTADFPAPIWSLLIKNSIFRKKIMDESFIIYDDLEFIIDILLKDVPFIYTPIIGTYYRQVQDSNQLTKTNRQRHDNDYILLLERMHAKDKSLIDRNPNIASLLKNAYKRKDKKNFKRLINLIDIKNKPVFIFRERLRIRNKTIAYIAFMLRYIIPKPILRQIGELTKDL